MRISPLGHFNSPLSPLRQQATTGSYRFFIGKGGRFNELSPHSGGRFNEQPAGDSTNKSFGWRAIQRRKTLAAGTGGWDCFSRSPVGTSSTLAP